MKETPKEDIIKAIQLLGLSVDHDRWDNPTEEGMIENIEYIRVKHPNYKTDPLIIYRKDHQPKSLEEIMQYDIDDTYRILGEYLMKIGEYRLQNKFHNLMNVAI